MKNFDGFGAGEIAIIKWQYRLHGDFFMALFHAITKADDTNLRRIGEGFPDEVEAFKKYSQVTGWWQDVEARWLQRGQ